MAVNQKPKLSLIENMTLSFGAAGISFLVSGPFERVKLLVQCQSEMIKQGTLTRPYPGIINCMTHTFRNEGLLAFWRGNLVPFIRYFPTQALNFLLKDKIKAAFKTKKNQPYMVNLAKNVASGGLAGTLSLCLVYSLDYARTRLSNDVKSAKNAENGRKYHGLIDVYKKTLATDGIIGLYRGFVISCVGIFIYRGCYFGLYDTLKPILVGPDAGLMYSFLLGYGVTITSALVTYPIDTIRRRMMMRSGEAVKYKGAMDCMFQVIRNEGTIALYRAAGFNILRGIVGAGMLAGFDKLVQVYTSVKVDTSGGGG